MPKIDGNQENRTAHRTAHEVIPSIVTLTEQRDQRSLEQSLLASLSEMLSSAECWLLVVPVEHNDHTSCVLLYGQADSLPAAMLEQGCAMPFSDTLYLLHHEDKTYVSVKLRDAEHDRTHHLFPAQSVWSEAVRQSAQGMIRSTRILSACCTTARKTP